MVPDDLRMEILEIQSKAALKQAYQENSLLFFYQKCFQEFGPIFKDTALKYLNMFGSTYICEQLFSYMKNIKSDKRNRLTDINLTSLLRIGTTHFNTRFSKNFEIQKTTPPISLEFNKVVINKILF